MGKICMDCGEIIHKNSMKCKYCDSDNINELLSTATLGDYFIIKKVSNDPKFIKAMMELHDTDIIEYTAKMNQFKQQVAVEENKPKCITCGSTNIQKISATSKIAGVAMFGIFSKTAKSQFKCNDCGCKW